MEHAKPNQYVWKIDPIEPWYTPTYIWLPRQWKLLCALVAVGIVPLLWNIGPPFAVALIATLIGLAAMVIRTRQLQGAALNLHALHLTHREQWPQAGEMLDEALSNHALGRGLRARVLLNRAIVFIRQGNPMEALSLLYSLEQSPSMTQGAPLYERLALETALALALVGNLQEAKTYLEKSSSQTAAKRCDLVDLRILISVLLYVRKGEETPCVWEEHEIARIAESQFMRRTLLVLMDYHALQEGSVPHEICGWRAEQTRKLHWLGSHWPEMHTFLETASS